MTKAAAGSVDLAKKTAATPPVLKLGVKAKDAVSGLTGIVTAKVIQMSGNIQYQISPEGDGKTMDGGYAFDQHQIDVIDAGLSDRAGTPPAGFTPIKLGSEVECKITGFKGIATEETHFLNGCVYYFVAPKAKKKTEYPSGILINSDRLKIKGKPVVEAKPATEKTTGGPATRITSMGR